MLGRGNEAGVFAEVGGTVALEQILLLSWCHVVPSRFTDDGGIMVDLWSGHTVEAISNLTLV